MRRLLTCVSALAVVVAACSDVAEETAATEDALGFARVGPVDTTLPEVDATGYDIELAVDAAPGRETFRAVVDATYVATADLTELALDFEGNAIDDVRVGGRHAEHRRDGGRLVVVLPSRVAKGRTFTTRIAYHGDVGQAESMSAEPHTAFGGLMVEQHNRENARIFTSMSWPSKARRWLPLRDHPRDAAQVRFKATWPKSFTVIANGRQLGATENADGSKTWRYEALTPMPTYAFHVAAYEGWRVESRRSTSNVPITTYTYARDAGKERAIYGDIPPVMDFYEATFGRYRWGSESFIEEPIFGGGMEHASVVSMDEDLLDYGTDWTRYTAIHELAHHWSGDLVHIRQWNDFWLSEGFTQYLSYHAVEKIDGAEAARTLRRGFLEDALKYDASNPHPIAPAGAEANIYDVYDAISYQKGALVLRMLEHVVGKEKMLAFLKGWFERHAFGPAVSTDDFERELERETGKDLSGIFATFVRGTHHPELRVKLTPVGTETEITVEQVQTQGPPGGFRFPLDVDLVDDAGAKERFTIELTGKTTKKRVRPDRTPRSVVVDPDEYAIAVTASN